MRAGAVLGAKIICPLIKGKKYRSMLTAFTDELRLSKKFRDRQIYIHIAKHTYSADNYARAPLSEDRKPPTTLIRSVLPLEPTSALLGCLVQTLLGTTLPHSR